MSFEGIQKTCRSVRCAAVLHGWLVVRDSRAGTDSRYLEIARGSQYLKLRISDHPPTRDCDMSVSPTEESIDEAMAVLAAPPVFSEPKEAEDWLRAMRARHLWAEFDRASRVGEAGAEELKARAAQQAPRRSYLVARGDGRLHPVDIEWLRRVEQERQERQTTSSDVTCRPIP